MKRFIPVFILLGAPAVAYEVAPEAVDIAGDMVLSAPAASDAAPTTLQRPQIDITLLIPASAG